MTASPHPATFLAGERMPFEQLPREVKAWVAGFVGRDITAVRDVSGGMSVSVAAVVTGPTGSVFVKVIDSVSNPRGHQTYVNERDLARRLPHHPTIPALLGSNTLTLGAPDGTPVEWTMSCFRAAEGRTPAHPWNRHDLVRVLDALADLQPVLHSTPCDWTPDGDPAAFLSRWQAIADDADDAWNDHADRWLAPTLDLAHRIATDTPRVLSHVDLRADNIVISPTQVSFVDWATPGLSAPWLDSLLLVLDAAGSGADLAQGGEIDLPALWVQHPLTQELPADMLITGAAALAAGCHRGARRVIPGLPHRQTWTRAMADGLLAFAEHHAT